MCTYVCLKDLHLYCCVYLSTQIGYESVYRHSNMWNYIVGGEYKRNALGRITHASDSSDVAAKVWS